MISFTRLVLPASLLLFLNIYLLSCISKNWLDISTWRAQRLHKPTLTLGLDYSFTFHSHIQLIAKKPRSHLL